MEKFNYLLRLGDDSLILGQRLAEWCGHGPILEEDIAMTNISLDLIGQAISLLNYAGDVESKGRDGDALAFLRLEKDYKNLLLVEQKNGDFGDTMMRQFLFDAYRKLLFERLQNSTDKQLAAIAEKSLKETPLFIIELLEFELPPIMKGIKLGFGILLENPGQSKRESPLFKTVFFPDPTISKS